MKVAALLFMAAAVVRGTGADDCASVVKQECPGMTGPECMQCTAQHSNATHAACPTIQEVEEACGITPKPGPHGPPHPGPHGPPHPSPGAHPSPATGNCADVVHKECPGETGPECMQCTAQHSNATHAACSTIQEVEEACGITPKPGPHRPPHPGPGHAPAPGHLEVVYVGEASDDDCASVVKQECPGMTGPECMQCTAQHSNATHAACPTIQEVEEACGITPKPGPHGPPHPGPHTPPHPSPGGQPSPATGNCADVVHKECPGETGPECMQCTAQHSSATHAACSTIQEVEEACGITPHPTPHGPPHPGPGHAPAPGHLKGSRV